MLSCEVVTDLMAVYESGEASVETRRLVDEHLAGCAACRAAFGKGARVESVLSRAKPEVVQKPVNGTNFVARTRRLWFFIGAGVLLLFAAQAAIAMRVFRHTLVFALPLPSSSHTSPVSPFDVFRVPPTLALLATVVTAGAFIALVVSTARRARISREGAVVRAVLGGALLTILALSALYLWVAGSPGPGLLAFVLLITALVVTATQLSRLPYFTIATFVSLIVAIVFLLNVMLVSQVIWNF
jgi:predicted anti-sigma-YlaC factor YlaD